MNNFKDHQNSRDGGKHLFHCIRYIRRNKGLYGITLAPVGQALYTAADLPFIYGISPRLLPHGDPSLRRDVHAVALGDAIEINKFVECDLHLTKMMPLLVFAK